MNHRYKWTDAELAIVRSYVIAREKLKSQRDDMYKKLAEFHSPKSVEEKMNLFGQEVKTMRLFGLWDKLPEVDK